MAISIYETDMDKIVNCAQCNEELKYSESYTSMEKQTYFGFGYAVCSKCYNEEWIRRRERECRDATD